MICAKLLLYAVKNQQKLGLVPHVTSLLSCEDFNIFSMLSIHFPSTQ